MADLSLPRSRIWCRLSATTTAKIGVRDQNQLCACIGVYNSMADTKDRICHTCSIGCCSHVRDELPVHRALATAGRHTAVQENNSCKVRQRGHGGTCAGAPSHISTGSRSTSRTTALLSRLKTGPRTQGGPCTGPAASGHGGSLNTRKDDPSIMYAAQHGPSSVSHSKFAPAGRIGVIGQSGRCGRQVPSKRPHALCSRQQEALEAAGLGFSQSSGDFC